jgi:hypothetical protein
MRRLDIAGRMFGRLVAIRFIAKHATTEKWECACACGKMVIVRKNNLLSGNTSSCGCARPIPTVRARKHGFTAADSPFRKTYFVWFQMIGRCTKTHYKSYPEYGGRGISVCRAWFSFENFVGDMGTAPLGLSIERINNDGNYEPNNCRWATMKEQSRNKRPRRYHRRPEHCVSTQLVSKGSEGAEITIERIE